MGFWSDFTGASARRDLKRGLGQANEYLDRGKQDAANYLNQEYSVAHGYLEPYVQGGQQGQQFYEDLLGLNGADARTAAQEILTSDPAYQGQLGQSQNAVLRAMNARGLGASGAGALAAERVFQQNYGNILNRYAGLGRQGFGAATQRAGLAERYGGQQAGLSYGRAQQGANLAMGHANAMANSRGTLMNNLLKVAGTTAKAFAPMPGKVG